MYGRGHKGLRSIPAPYLAQPLRPTHPVTPTKCIMRPSALDDHVAWCVDLSVIWLRCAKTAERIGVLLTVETIETQETLC